jgi:hypothetical protein
MSSLDKFPELLSQFALSSLPKSIPKPSGAIFVVAVFEYMIGEHFILATHHVNHVCLNHILQEWCLHL